MSRHKARVLAFQALYAWDVGKIEKEDLLFFSWYDPKENAKKTSSQTQVQVPLDNAEYEQTLTYARLLFSGTIESIDEVDDLIKRHLKNNWDYKRIDRVAVAILRLSVYTLLFQKQIDAPVVIDEAIRIAKEYANEETFSFVNGILDKIKEKIKKNATD